MRYASLLLLILAACAPDEPDLAEEIDEVMIGDTDFRCGTGDFYVNADEPERIFATYTTTVVAGQPRFIDAWVWGEQVNQSGDNDIMQLTGIRCTGPVSERIQTTQNALREGPAIKTTAHLVLTTPGTYTCSLGTRTTHEGARLKVFGQQSCLAASNRREARDWPTDNSQHDTIGEGRRVSKGAPAHVLPTTLRFSPTANRVALGADIELTNINSSGSGTTIVACEQEPYSKWVDAKPKVTLQARQVCTDSNCVDTPFGRVCPYTQGTPVEVTISPRVHHYKVFAKLDMPISKAPDCSPFFYVRARIEARGTSNQPTHPDAANDLCFHAARYSNIWGYVVD